MIRAIRAVGCGATKLERPAILLVAHEGQPPLLILATTLRGAVAENLPQLVVGKHVRAVGKQRPRLTTVLAEPANKDMVLRWALAGTASHVEKMVRLFRRVNRSHENELAEEQQQCRDLVTYFDSSGMLVVQGRLPPEQACSCGPWSGQRRSCSTGG